MKLVIAIVHPEDAGALVDALTDKEYRVTRLQGYDMFPQTMHIETLVQLTQDQAQ